MHLYKEQGSDCVCGTKPGCRVQKTGCRVHEINCRVQYAIYCSVFIPQLLIAAEAGGYMVVITLNEPSLLKHLYARQAVSSTAAGSKACEDFLQLQRHDSEYQRGTMPSPGTADCSVTANLASQLPSTIVQGT
jgi:hypothetical protein